MNPLLKLVLSGGAAVLLLGGVLLTGPVDLSQYSSGDDSNSQLLAAAKKKVKKAIKKAKKEVKEEVKKIKKGKVPPPQNVVVVPDQDSPLIESTELTIGASGFAATFKVNEKVTWKAWLSTNATVPTSSIAPTAAISTPLSLFAMTFDQLIPGQNYYLFYEFKDAAGNTTSNMGPTPLPLVASIPSTLDQMPPELTSFSILEVTETSIKVKVVTNKPAKVSVSANPTVSSTGFSVDTILTLTGLTPGTTYNLTCTLTDSSGNTTNCGPYGATTLTLLPPDTTQPWVVSYSGSILGNTGTVTIVSNEPVKRKLYYCVFPPGAPSSCSITWPSPLTALNQPGMLTFEDLSLEASKTVTVPNLAPGTYYLHIVLTDAAGNATHYQSSGVSSSPIAWIYWGNAIDVSVPPTIYSLTNYPNPPMLDATTTVAGDFYTAIYWHTYPQQSDSSVWYGESSPVDTSGPPNIGSSIPYYNHDIPIGGLPANKTIYYKVASTNTNGLTAYSEEKSFTTPAAP